MGPVNDEAAPALLVLPFRDREAFRRNLSLPKGRPALFVDGEVELAVGASLLLEVQFLNDGVHLSTDAVLAFRRRASQVGQSLRPGVGIELVPGPDTDLLLGYAKGMRLLARGDRRFGVKIKTRCTHPEGACWGHLRDLSDSGAALVADAPVMTGDHIELRLYPPGSFLGVKAGAEVKWTAEHDFGVQFACDSDRAARKIHDLVERERQRRRDAPRLRLVPAR
jgi:hypothetical protein